MNDILDDSYDSDLTEAESTELLLMCGHAIASPLSPAARAILEAVMNAPDHMTCEIAAALRAAADQVVPLRLIDEPGFSPGSCCERVLREERAEMRGDLLAIAAELEGSHD
jgi:hypothetical protein